MPGRAKTGGNANDKSALTGAGRSSALAAADHQPSVDELREQLENTRLQLREAWEQQTATAEIIKNIGRSAFDLKTVLQGLVESACRLCEADMGNIARPTKDDRYRIEGSFGQSVALQDELMHGPLQGKGSVIGRTALTRATVHIPDAQNDPDYELQNALGMGGYHTMLGVPLMREGQLIGVFGMARRTVRPFTDRQIELVTTFADQAAIAIENARLFDELQARTRDLSEALTYQTSSSNILRVIASSPTDIGPVLETVAEKACEVCAGFDATLVLRDARNLRVRAHSGPIALAYESWPNDLTSISGRAMADRAIVHVRDILSDEGANYPSTQEMCRRDGVGTMLAAPMLHEGEAIGAIVLRRIGANPFTDKQIAALLSFADQAVIAIRNVRLFEQVQERTRELADSLQQQTATAEVLRVINSSPGHLEPVFAAILEKATHLCDASFGILWLSDGEQFRTAALHGVPLAYAEITRTPIRPLPTNPLGRMLRGERLIVSTDVSDEEPYRAGDPARRALVDVAGARSVIQVALAKEDVFLGSLTVYRKEVRPFSEKQIALLQNFAAQAVIAIENVNLFNQVQAKTRDLEESLQQQTATADVLKAISRSAFDLKAVLNALIEAAARLCEADQGAIARQQGQAFVRVATWGFSEEFSRMVAAVPIEPARGSAIGRALLERVPVHIPNVDSDPEYNFTDAKRLGRFKTIIAVPMLREGAPIGVLSLTRIEERPFTPKQLQLVSTFTDQAAIAIENVRLFEQIQAKSQELSQSLEDLRAAQDRLVQTEKLASLGQLTAGIAHEIKNPLNFVNNFSALSSELIGELNDLLKDAALTDKMRRDVEELTGLLKDNLEKVVQHGKRADSIVKNMLLHARESSGEQRSADINALVEESLNLAYHAARAEKSGFNIALQREFDADAGVAEVFPQEITRALLNVISNGFYAAAKRSSEAATGFEPRLRATTKNLGNLVQIRIRDNGAGIPSEIKAKIFNPFFTTKPAGEGTGLGLSMSHDIIVKQHGGTIEVHSEPGAFTEFVITLPRAISEQSPRRSTH